MYEYSISKDKWTETNTPMSQKRQSHSCLVIGDEVLVTGGLDENYNNLKSTEIFDSKQRRWRTGPELPTGIHNAQLVRAKSGFDYIAYLIGGEISIARASSAVYGNTRGFKKLLKIEDLDKERRSHVAFILHENISETCNN